MCIGKTSAYQEFIASKFPLAEPVDYNSRIRRYFTFGFSNWPGGR
ncbi:hypothetical protein SAMN05421753_108176 [Planctomicrobium piriforme]|uniref:Uncharacterized protein n=1 Tax=Planctomicrobium piriforme TaxID=1576369 RepID=A0A1I3HT35_9PLAN|nr:hypothetical protein SAMN05421753_108176 [Planctomicrobium piriforme]